MVGHVNSFMGFFFTSIQISTIFCYQIRERGQYPDIVGVGRDVIGLWWLLNVQINVLFCYNWGQGGIIEYRRGELMRGNSFMDGGLLNIPLCYTD